VQPGAFSLSLAVKDIAASTIFYGHLGFSPVGGDPEQGWVILRSGDVTIGLFKGMFDHNLMTFNPGWDAQAQPVEDFEDIRKLQTRLQAAGIDIANPVDPHGAGPASFLVTDPDGNPILFDQHV